MRRSGMASSRPAMKPADAVGREHVGRPRTWSRAAGAHMRHRGLEFVCPDRLEVGSRHGLGLLPGCAAGAAACWRTFAATSCTFVAASLVLCPSAIAASFTPLQGRSLVSAACQRPSRT